MKYLRAPDLAFWVVAVVAMLAVTVFAATRGGEAVAGGDSVVPIGAPAPSSSEATTQVTALTALMSSGTAAGTDPAALTSFANTVLTQAQQGSALRAGEGAADDDQMLAGFDRAAHDAQRLASQVNDPVAATALRTQIGLDVDYLNRLASGQPVPDLPAGGLDPYAGNSQPGTPQPTTPNRPSTPTLGVQP